MYFSKSIFRWNLDQDSHSNGPQFWRKILQSQTNQYSKVNLLGLYTRVLYFFFVNCVLIELCSLWLHTSMVPNFSKRNTKILQSQTNQYSKVTLLWSVYTIHMYYTLFLVNCVLLELFSLWINTSMVPNFEHKYFSHKPTNTLRYVVCVH